MKTSKQTNTCNLNGSTRGKITNHTQAIASTNDTSHLQPVDVEARTVPARIPQNQAEPRSQHLLAHHERVAPLWCLLIVSGYLALFGILLSAVSAQPHFANRDVQLAAILNALPLPSRRRRQPPARSGVCASYARYSSDKQSELSIPDQQRECRAWGVAHGLTIDPQFEFGDEAISGTKRDRDGFDQLISAAKSGKIGVLVFESLSRFSRELAISLPLLKDLVHNHNVRIISVKEGIDSDMDNWETLAIVFGLGHGHYIRALSQMCFRGLVGNVQRNYSNGDYPFGYTSQPVPGAFTGTTKDARPKMAYAIDELQAKWVRQVFNWFVAERRTLRWIARELTRLDVPKDHRSSEPGWHTNQVRNMLTNPKYVGVWAWGRLKNERDPLTGKVRQIERSAEEYEPLIRLRPDLRIIDDEPFEAAQQILHDNEERRANCRQPDGRFSSVPTGGNAVRHLLQGIFRCGLCNSSYQVCGTGGQYLGCSGNDKGLCPCRTHVRRDLAEKLLLAEIGRHIKANPEWVELIFAKVVESWKLRQAQQDQLSGLEGQLKAIDERINRLVDRVEDGDPDADIARRLKQRRSERNELLHKIAVHTARQNKPNQAPTRRWVEDQISALHEVLQGGGPQAHFNLKALVGESIPLTELPRPIGKRKFMRGRLRLNVTNVAAALDGQSACTDWQSEGDSDIFLDFYDAPVWTKIMDQAKALVDSGMTDEQVSRDLKCPEVWVFKAVRYWYTQHGLTPPDRRKVPIKRQPTPIEPIVVPVMELWNQNLHIYEIARHLGLSRKRVRAAIKFWQISQGLPWVDGRTRRKNLGRG
jgi:site-specific DNA recombinase